MTNKNKEAFSKFINFSFGQKEASIVIAKNKKEQEEFVNFLEEIGFQNADAVYKFQENLKTYFISQGNIDKDIYDFMAQYSTGQIEIFDKNNMKSNIYTPDYTGKAIIIIALNNNLKKLKKNNFDLLAISGLAYQS